MSPSSYRCPPPQLTATICIWQPIFIGYNIQIIHAYFSAADIVNQLSYLSAFRHRIIAHIFYRYRSSTGSSTPSSSPGYGSAGHQRCWFFTSHQGLFTVTTGPLADRRLPLRWLSSAHATNNSKAIIYYYSGQYILHNLSSSDINYTRLINTTTGHPPFFFSSGIIALPDITYQLLSTSASSAIAAGRTPSSTINSCCQAAIAKQPWRHRRRRTHATTIIDNSFTSFFFQPITVLRPLTSPVIDIYQSTAIYTILYRQSHRQQTTTPSSTFFFFPVNQHRCRSRLAPTNHHRLRAQRRHYCRARHCCCTTRSSNRAYIRHIAYSSIPLTIFLPSPPP